MENFVDEKIVKEYLFLYLTIHGKREMALKGSRGNDKDPPSRVRALAAELTASLSEWRKRQRNECNIK